MEEFYKSESEHESEEEESTQEVDLPEKTTDPPESVEGKSVESSQSDTQQLRAASTGDSGVEADASFSGTQRGIESNSELTVDAESEQADSMYSAEKMDVENISEGVTATVPSTPSNAIHCNETSSSSKVLPDALCSEEVQKEVTCVEGGNVKSLIQTQDDSPTGEKNVKIMLETQDSQDIILQYSETEPILKNVKSILQTQDSQDISLHYSETEPLSKNDTEIFKDLTMHANDDNAINDDSAINDDNAINNDKLSDGNKAKSSTWEELNSAMKDLDDDSEVSPLVTFQSFLMVGMPFSLCIFTEGMMFQDIAPNEVVPKKLSFGSGPRLSLKGAPNDVIDLDDLHSNPRTPGVKGLIERFMKHSASKKKEDQTVELRYFLLLKD